MPDAGINMTALSRAGRARKRRGAAPLRAAQGVSQRPAQCSNDVLQKRRGADQARMITVAKAHELEPDLN